MRLILLTDSTLYLVQLGADFLAKMIKVRIMFGLLKGGDERLSGPELN